MTKKYKKQIFAIILCAYALLTVGITTFAAGPGDNFEYKKITQRNLMSKEDAFFEKQLTIKSFLGKEQVFTLDDVEFLPTKLTGRKVTINARTEYYDCVRKPKANGTVPVEFFDETTGQTVYADAVLDVIKQTGASTWKKDFKIDGKAIEYDSNSYVLKDIIIPYCDDKPIITGQEKKIIKLFNLEENRHKIENASWTGAPYEKSGTLIRELEITGSRLVGNWVAYYIAPDIPLADIDTWKAVATYSAPKEQKNIFRYIIDFIIAHPFISVLFLLLAILIVLFVMAQKRKEGKNE